METNNLFRFFMEKFRTSHTPSPRLKAELESAQNAPKFMLPVNGQILDGELKGVPSDFQLPFPKIVVEYDSWVNLEDAEFFANKKIKAARVEGDRFLQKNMVIATQHEGKIELRFIGRIKGKTEEDNINQVPGYTVLLPCQWSGDFNGFISNLERPDVPLDINYVNSESAFKKLQTDDSALSQLAAKATYVNPMLAILSLVEALSCKNVTHEALPVRKLNKGAAKRGALPFDEYRVLVINTVKGKGVKAGSAGDRHSPREHLRRGHVRVYESGLRVWVQSTVVNAGIGSSINKDYKVK